jgi:mannose-6-phosphate isomerase-like protein (cupin superfamily)
MTEHRQEVEQEWARRGFSCDIWVDPPGQEWRDFVHPMDELVMLIEGELELSFRGNTLRPSAGQEVLIPAETPHTVSNVGGTTNRWYYGYRRRK